MGYIGNEPTTGHFPVDNFTSSGGSTYTLTRAPASAGAIEVSVQGVLQPTTAYTVSGSTLNMAGVTTGVKIFVRHLGETLSLPTPADGSVTTAKLGTNSVDGTKIAMGSDAAGDILYHGATDYARLAKGTAAQVLTMNAGATAPEWGAAAGGGLNFISKVTASNDATVDFLTSFSSTYDTYLFTFYNVVPGTDAMSLAFRVAQGGAIKTDAGYTRVILGHNEANANHHSGGTGQGQLYISPMGTGSATVDEHTSGNLWIYNPLSSAVTPLLTRAWTNNDSNLVYVYSGGGSYHTNNTALTGGSFNFDNGTIGSGEFVLYGLAKS